MYLPKDLESAGFYQVSFVGGDGREATAVRCWGTVGSRRCCLLIDQRGRSWYRVICV